MIPLTEIQSNLTTECTAADLDEYKEQLLLLNAGPKDKFWNCKFHPGPLRGYCGIALVRQGKVIDFIHTKKY